MQTMLPGAPARAVNPWAAPPEWWEGSFFQDLFNRMERAAQRITAAEEGSLRREQMAKEQHDAVVTILIRTEASSKASWDGMRGQLETWRKASEAKDADQDQQIEELRKAIAAVKQEVLSALPEAMQKFIEPYIARIEALEKELAHRVGGSPEATPG